MQFIENTKGIPSKGQLFYRFEGGKFEEERRLQKNVSYLTENAEDNAYAVRNLDLMNKGLQPYVQSNLKIRIELSYDLFKGEDR